MQVNLPEVVAEVTACCEAYEQALVANDVEALCGFFWSSPLATRFGVTEELYGAEAISAFRASRKVSFADRQVLRHTVLTLGRELGISMLEFAVTAFGSRKHGRQTQTWMRLPGAGWRVVSAHVSHKLVSAAMAQPAYDAAAAALLGMPVEDAFREGISRNIEIMARIAAPLMARELPADLPPAPVFKP
jgi:Protein of unknown function (DUF3225)/Protein of unknown function (DUF4089)